MVNESFSPEQVSINTKVASGVSISCSLVGQGDRKTLSSQLRTTQVVAPLCQESILPWDETTGQEQPAKSMAGGGSLSGDNCPKFSVMYIFEGKMHY